ncbi:hypothetical protein HY374_03285 [Candidatus Berkelbacteria bacterium]|nr:hypothetical protein [Candidatus Berkelbacteria bacterium]
MPIFQRRQGQLLRGVLAVALSIGVLAAPEPTQAADFNASNLISDGEFTDTNSMSAAEVQRFLEDQGSFLADYSQNGRTAAQIIWDAAHGKNEASGTINGIAITESTGTVSPKVILVTLQKEQSLISRTSQNDDALRAAMGYACPDSGGCNSAYAGFTKQVENGAWQLRYNYERAQGTGFSDYQVGQSFCTSDHNGTNCGTYDNRSTAALYRYTPHVYNGNYNFWNMFYNTYSFTSPEYAASIVSWSSSEGMFTYPTLDEGETSILTITYRNTGRSTWTRGTVNIGTVETNFSHRFSSYPLARDWLSTNRPAQLNESSVAPGATGTFSIVTRNPGSLSAGNYRLDVGLVADGITWFSQATHAYWDVTVPQAYAGQWLGQTAYPSLTENEAAYLSIQYRNTGAATWQQGVVNLGTVDTSYRYRLDSYQLASNWLSGNRLATLTESSVAPGEVGTFTFRLEHPGNLSGGNYRLDVGLVADGITWFSQATHAYWDVTVPQAYAAQWVSQSSYPNLGSGDSATLTITYRNTGARSWTRGTVNLGTVETNFAHRFSNYGLATSWLSANRPAQLNESSVAPGETGSFTFTIRNPGTLSAGNHRLDVGLVADGITWFSQATHAYWDVIVR